MPKPLAGGSASCDMLPWSTRVSGLDAAYPLIEAKLWLWRNNGFPSCVPDPLAYVSDVEVIEYRFGLNELLSATLITSTYALGELDRWITS